MPNITVAFTRKAVSYLPRAVWSTECLKSKRWVFRRPNWNLNLGKGQFNLFNIGFFSLMLNEPLDFSRSYFGNVNYFGGPGEISCKSMIALSQAQVSIDTMIVFLSDVWLDSPKVLEKLQTLFIGYSECPPYAFVMCGNFLSEFNYGLRCDELTGLLLILIQN